MLQNVTLLAIVAIHTAANEPKVRQVMNKIHRNVGSVVLGSHPFRGPPVTSPSRAAGCLAGGRAGGEAGGEAGWAAGYWLPGQGMPRGRS